MKILLIGLLVLGSISAYATSIQEIVNVFENNKERIADEIRVKRPAYQDMSTDEIFFSRNCEPASRALAKYLKDANIAVDIIQTPKHVYLKHRRLIIDPTYRQFYAVGLNEEVRILTGSSNYMFDNNDFREMPEILIVTKKKLRSTLESFPLKPEWQVKVGGDFFGFYPSVYEDWYIH